MPSNPLQSLCLLRTSALGDVTHVVPLVRTLRSAWPQARLTWLVGKPEHRLVGDIEGVEFVVFDKAAGLRGYLAARRALSDRRFDALLHMQVALRANLLSLCVHADRRIGYDAARSRDLHGFFVDRTSTSRCTPPALSSATNRSIGWLEWPMVLIGLMACSFYDRRRTRSMKARVAAERSSARQARLSGTLIPGRPVRGL